MSDKKMYANTTDSSVVVDDEGHMIDGGARGEFKPNKQIRHLVDLGLLVEVSDEPAKGKTAEQKRNLAEQTGESGDSGSSSSKSTTGKSER